MLWFFFFFFFFFKEQCLPFPIYEYNKPDSTGERSEGGVADACGKGCNIYNTVNETFKVSKLK